MFETFTVIAGPCVLEDTALNLEVARELAAQAAAFGVDLVFKASFDKANRALDSSPRGPGLREGLARLAEVKAETGLPLITDVHEPWQAGEAAEVVDALQVPAFLCRQTDLLRAVGATGKPVNVKKGQWMAPDAMAGAVEKVRAAGGGTVAVTERGTFFGYGDLVVDMRSFSRLRRATGAPALFDATHSVQRPGLAGGSSGGEPAHVEELARAAVAAGCDGLFFETHPSPRQAPSDGATMVPLGDVARLLERALAVRAR